jgi:hypothetical protein
MELGDEDFGVWYLNTGTGKLSFGDVELDTCGAAILQDGEMTELTIEIDTDVDKAVSFKQGESLLGKLHGLPSGRALLYAAQPFGKKAFVSFV